MNHLSSRILIASTLILAGTILVGAGLIGIVLHARPHGSAAPKTIFDTCTHAYDLDDRKLTRIAPEQLRDHVYNQPVLLSQIGGGIDCLPVLEAQRQFLQAAP